MKIVQVHNFYQQPGGEDTVVAAEKRLLEQNGHIVIPYYKHNHTIDDLSGLKKLKLFNHLHFDTESYRDCVQFLEKHQPDICHVHNTFHLVSSAIYKACKATNTPVVCTLHNYRSICANGMLTRNKRPCEDCLNQSAYQAVKYKCYRNSYLQTFAVARMIEQHKRNQLVQNDIDAFICFTDFAKDKFIKHGIPNQKIHLKPNFADVAVTTNTSNEEFLVYVGRLEKAKGIELLTKIAKNSPLPIYVVGDGPLKKILESQSNIKLTGRLSHANALSYIKGAKALLFPSLVYEGMPMTLIEAFASNTPIIASNLGAMADMIKHKKNGLLFEPNNHHDLLKKINYLLKNEELSYQLAINGYSDYQSKYNPESNYKYLNNIYQSILRQ